MISGHVLTIEDRFGMARTEAGSGGDAAASSTTRVIKAVADTAGRWRRIGPERPCRRCSMRMTNRAASLTCMCRSRQAACDGGMPRTKATARSGRRRVMHSNSRTCRRWAAPNEDLDRLPRIHQAHTICRLGVSEPRQDVGHLDRCHLGHQRRRPLVRQRPQPLRRIRRRRPSVWDALRAKPRACRPGRAGPAAGRVGPSACRWRPMRDDASNRAGRKGRAATQPVAKSAPCVPSWAVAALPILIAGRASD